MGFRPGKRHFVALALGLVLVIAGFDAFEWFGVLLLVTGWIATLAGILWILFAWIRFHRREAEAAEDVIRSLGLERDPEGERGTGGFPCVEILACYRGRFDGAPVQWINVRIGRLRRSATRWIASTGMSPPLRTPFQIARSLASLGQPAPHPLLPPGTVLACDSETRIGEWLAALEEPVRRQLQEHLLQPAGAGLSDHGVFRFVVGLDRLGVPAARTAFAEIIALARKLSATSGETAPYEIHASFHYVRYQEGASGFELDIDPGLAESWVYVPDPAEWVATMPAWAAGRRTEIVARLRANLDEKHFKFVAGA